MLNVECDKRGRRGRYRLDRLIERYGIDAKLFDWEPEFDCPRKLARHEMTHAALGCRDCSKFRSLIVTATLKLRQEHFVIDRAFETLKMSITAFARKRR